MLTSLKQSKENISGLNIATAATDGPNVPKITGKICYWNGQGPDQKWSNPLNWLGETIPTAADCVILDGRCLKNVVLDINAEIKALMIAPGYTGSLSGWNDLIVSENVLIQGGSFEVSLLCGGDVTIVNGKLNSCLSTLGNFTISGGKVIWESGEVCGNTILKGGVINFNNSYNRYFTFKGDFIREGGKIEGTPIFSFQGNQPQVFNVGFEEMKLQDIYNGSELNLQGNVKIEGFFFNSGIFKVRPTATLDLELVNCFSNTGTLIAEGKIIPSLQPTVAKQKNA